jgi:hypothetical protein
MKRSLAVLCCLGLVVGFGGLAVAQPTFDLTWDGCPPATGEYAPGPLTVELTGVLMPGNLVEGEAGAQGWSLSVAPSGAATLTDITTAGTIGADVNDTPPGLRDTGFEKSELTPVGDPPSAGSGDCAASGNVGGVSAVVLSFTQPITLDPVNPSEVVKVTLEGTVPPAGTGPDDEQTCETWGIAFVDGCQGSGQPVDNKVTYEGQTVVPSLGECEFDVCGPKWEPTCEGAPLNIIVQEGTLAWVEDDPAVLRHQTLDVNDGMVTGSVDDDADLTSGGSLTLYHAIASNDVRAGADNTGDPSGVQGWSLSLRVTGDISLDAVTTADTAGADVQGDSPGLRDTGFEKSEIVDPTKIHPDTGLEQGPGAVSAVVLSFTLPITLEPTGTATALASTVSGELEACGAIEGFDNMTGSGQPVKNVATVGGGTRAFCRIQTANICFAVPPIGTFIRCDPNEDGITNIADAVWIVNELFRGGPPTSCREAADCNDDGLEDLTDAVYGIEYQFNGGPPPPPPFPDCGKDEGETPSTEDSCPAGSNGLCP